VPGGSCCVELSRSADFDAFFRARTEALVGLVESAMGKRVVRADETTGEQADAPDSFDLEPDEPDDDIELGNEASVDR
jgi:hypothetical protein